jgi:hypothetical protein
VKKLFWTLLITGVLTTNTIGLRAGSNPEFRWSEEQHDRSSVNACIGLLAVMALTVIGAAVGSCLGPKPKAQEAQVSTAPTASDTSESETPDEGYSSYP